MSLNNDLNQVLKNLSQTKPTNEPFEPVLTPTGEPVEPTTAAAATPNVVLSQTPVTPSSAAPAAPEPTPVPDGLIEDWKTDVTPAEPTAVTPTTPVVDFSEIAKVLGKEKINDQKEVVIEVSELKKRAEMLNSIPKDLAEAIDIASKNGNYLEYLQVSVVDWAKEDPIVLYENYVEDQCIDPTTGQVDYERADKILDKLDEDEKDFKGRELQKQYMAYQTQQREFIKQQAVAKQAQFESDVKRAVNELKDVNGFVIGPADKAALVEFVLKGEDLRANDVRSRVVNAFITKNFNNMTNYLKTKARNTTQREILQEATVPEIKASSEPTPATPTKQYSIHDYIQELAQKKGF